MKITKIWFDGDYIYGRKEDGSECRQSLLWYRPLRAASDSQRAQYRFGFDGIHWPELDVDISFESFDYEDAEPSSMQRFFLTHPEINVAGFANSISLNPSLLRNYINGVKKPSKEREATIIQRIHSLGHEMISIPAPAFL